MSGPRAKPGVIEAVLRAAAERGPVRAAVVDPLDEPSLRGALAAANLGIIVPVLVGDRGAILRVAEECGASVDHGWIRDAQPGEEAATAARMAADGEVAILVKGQVHSNALLHAVLREARLRTERRVSHVLVLEVPGFDRPLFLSDAAVNIVPDLDEKRDIVQNAIDLAHALGVTRPLVAILAAVETVAMGMPSTVDAASLSKMAQRGQITGGIVDGPLALDDAVSEEAARLKGIASDVAGRADVLIVPDLDAGNLVFKTLDVLGHARFGGVVLGARVPIVVTSRGDGIDARIVSCAVAALLATHKKA